MTFHEKGFRSLATPMGQPADNSSAGETRQFHTYVTNDDRAAIETAGYFNTLWTGAKRVKTGDILLVSFDVDGNPGHRSYTIKISANVVVLVPVMHGSQRRMGPRMWWIAPDDAQQVMPGDGHRGVSGSLA